MRTLIKVSFLLVLLSPLAVAVIAWLALSPTALVTQQVDLSHADIARAKTILRQNDARHHPPMTNRTIELSSQDLNLAANYLLQKFARGGAQLDLLQNRMDVKASAQIPRLPWRRFVNIETSISTGNGRPEVTRLRIGQLAIPGSLATLIVQRTLAHFSDSAQAGSATGLVKRLQLFRDRLLITYRWNPALIDQARDTLLSRDDREALRVYHDRLVGLQSQGIGRNGSLINLLQPLFTTALERSHEHDPVAENVALLTLLGAWASRQDIGRLVPDQPQSPGSFRLKIEGRKDFAQHFLTSAALAARGDSALSDAVGLFKEISDTDSGSGFSFTDIAADRAGSRFGELATRSPQDARRVQQRLAAGVKETDIMPRAKDLPEHMRSDVFSQRFGHIGSPAYRRMMEEIEARINACSLYSD